MYVTLIQISGIGSLSFYILLLSSHLLEIDPSIERKSNWSEIPSWKDYRRKMYQVVTTEMLAERDPPKGSGHELSSRNSWFCFPGSTGHAYNCLLKPASVRLTRSIPGNILCLPNENRRDSSKNHRQNCPQTLGKIDEIIDIYFIVLCIKYVKPKKKKINK